MPDPTPARTAFRAAVEAHFAYPPATWRVEKIADRVWYTVRPDGARLDRCTTKRSAAEALLTGSAVRIWADHDSWYRETTRDPRNRPLEDWERAIVAEALEQHRDHP